MDYEKIYNNLISYSLNLSRQKGDGNYYELHHIVPKCIGGTNSVDNLVLLTAREHYVAHKLLCEIYPDNDKLHYSLWRMMNPQNKNHIRSYNISSYEYEYRRQIHQEKIRELGKKNKGNKFIMSDVAKKKMSDAKIGKPKSNSVKEKISNTLKGRTLSIEVKKKMSDVKIGKPSGMKGKFHSEETKEKIRQSLLNRKK